MMVCAPYTYGRFHNPAWTPFENALGELEAIRDAVAQIAPTPGSAARMLAEPHVDPSPYQKALQMLRLRIDDGLLHVLVLGDHLVVTGSAFAFEAFTSALHVAASAPPG